VIVRWSLVELPVVLAELGLERPYLVASGRWATLDVPRVAQWPEVPSHRIEVPIEADSLLAVGGGSAIDTAKLASSTTGLPVVSVPTTYSGAEWTPTFGVRAPDRRMVGGGSGARLAGIVYEVGLTVDLPRFETVGTAMNALAHCAEALYVRGRSDAGDEAALAGARLIATALPAAVATPDDVEARRSLQRGASYAGQALALAGLGLAHAIAQSLGGRYGLPHGAMNALSLPLGLRAARGRDPDAVARFEEALGGVTVEELAQLGSFGPLREFDISASELADVAAAAADRPGNRNMPRPATADEIETLLRSIH